MAQYTCTNGTCSMAGPPFSLTSVGQSFCPHCGTNSLSAYVPPPVAPATIAKIVAAGNTMDKGATNKKVLPILTAVIDKWDLDSVSMAEASVTSDHLFTHQTNSNRIDREGPVTGVDGTATHGKFRLQIGKKTYAGLHIKAGQTLDAATIRRAWRLSIDRQCYVEVCLGPAADNQLG